MPLPRVILLKKKLDIAEAFLEISLEPRGIMISLEFCPYCGKKTLSYPKSRFWACSECGLNLYNNVAAAVGLIFYIEGCVLFERRAKEPKKGFLTLPGGFVDPDESA